MLVLSRKPGEVLIIEGRDGPIQVVVVELLANRVKLGVDAPQHVAIHRQEIYEAIQREGKRQ